MSRSFLTPINLNQLELQNARVQNLSTTQINAIGTPVAGQIAYDSTLSTLKVYNGTGWTPVGSVSTGSGAPASAPTSTGSLYLDLTNLVVYVAKGTASSADWVPVMPYGLTGDMAALSTANAQGTSLKVSRADHVHRHTDADHSGIHLNALAAATGDYSMGGYKITSVATPVSANDAANKGYVDSTAQGLNVHASARLATTANLVATYAAGTTGVDGGTGVGATLTLTATGALTIDGTAVAVNDRILVKNQSTTYQNGIYTVTVAGTTGVSAVLTRATDFDNGNIAGEVVAGDFVFVAVGTTNQSSGWVQTATGTATTPANGIKIGTDAIVFSQFSGAGTYTATNGVVLAGNNFSFNPTSTGGLQTGASGASVLLPSTSGLVTSSTGLALNPTSTGGLTTSASGSLILLNSTSGLATTSSGLAVTPGLGITISAQGAAGAATTNQVAINTDVVARKYTTTIGDGTTTSYTVTHGLNTRFVQVTVFDASTYAQVFTDVANATVNTVTISFATAPGVSAYSVVVIG
jgi:hypothetical protein